MTLMAATRDYSARYIAFVQKHAEEYRTAYEAPTPSSARALLERLRRELLTLPRGHLCTCWCPNEPGYAPCSECVRLRAQRVRDDIGVDVGRTSPVEAPMPSVLMLDLERALSVLGTRTSATSIALWLSGEDEE